MDFKLYVLLLIGIFCLVWTTEARPGGEMGGELVDYEEDDDPNGSTTLHCGLWTPMMVSFLHLVYMRLGFH